MIYECTDCQNCASFDDGYRVYCLAANVSSREAYNYFPLGEENAKLCWGFQEGTPVEFYLKDHEQMLEDIKSVNEDDFYDAIRAWCIAHKKNY